MKKRLIATLAAVTAYTFTTGQVAAFSDTNDHRFADSIQALEEQGVLQGDESGLFMPNKELTYGAAAAMLSRGLSIQPKTLQPAVADTYTEMRNTAWYASYVQALLDHDIVLPKETAATQSLTREAFANLLHQAIRTTGEYTTTLQYIVLADEEKVNPEYMGSIQFLLITDIADLTQDETFAPQTKITRAEAAHWLANAVEYVESYKAESPEADQNSPQVSVQEVDGEAVGDQRQVQFTVEAPTPGYALHVANVEYQEGVATVTLELQSPPPDSIQLQVITEISVTEPIREGYEIEVNELISSQAEERSF
ncbi:S-layer homology domain-containing protein [Aureibacillus halotolerans]|uniref:S-layer family protein n=1 Tax=Aureibacillus halotolerans TaxID=1508390 RepID=A0A4R6TVQ8_9BACI|nr:S-layer homology domain-containing protein [Aureibacillus halotolerans]TDQ36772.1 S-layer family protein [Aureibacillus halotolerans]